MVKIGEINWLLVNLFFGFYSIVRMGISVVCLFKANLRVHRAPSGGELIEKKRRKRKRKGQMPKNYDPSCDPDPERWLPRHERSTFRKKKDRRMNKDIGKGTQGAATGAIDQ